jgi:hypothetical protein
MKEIAFDQDGNMLDTDGSPMMSGESATGGNASPAGNAIRAMRQFMSPDQLDAVSQKMSQAMKGRTSPLTVEETVRIAQLVAQGYT